MWLLMLLLADSVSAQDWSVLAVRVSFPREVPDDPTTTGDGRFDLRSPEEAGGEYRLPFDLPPHDRKYFRAHLRALGHYWHTASGGKLRINFEVYPEEDTASYRMPRPLIWYGSGRGDEASKRLVQLFRDAVTALDSAEDVDFSKFRIVVVFHAGVGRETGEYNDISSAYLTPDDFERYGPVVAGGDTLWEGIILPEALRPDGIGGLNGLMAKVFGYALGLPELSNTGDGLPALGGWSLMDVGWLNPTEIEGRLGWGFVPCLPSAWELMHLGWLEPLEVVRDTTVWVAAAHLSEVPEDAVRALKVPVGPKEYFLIENRKAHYRQAELSERNQVWLWVDSYDASVPGSGVLIWHVDEGVISERPNDPNDDPLSRGIDLEEADGDEAIGNPNREGNMWGGPGDPFYLGGNSRFGPDTTPSSRSNRGWDTGIEIEVLDPPRDLMRVRVSFRRNFPRWPKDVIEDLSHSAPLPTTYELLILGRDRLYMLGLRNMSLPLPVVPFGIPAAGDIDDDGLLEVAFVDSSGVLWWPAKGRWDSASVGFRPTSGPVVADMLPEEGIEVAVGGDGEVALLRPGEGVVLREELEGRVSGMAFGRDVGLLCLTEEGGVFSVRGGRVRRLWTGGLGWSSGPVIGDIDGDQLGIAVR
ncbi:MAG TPA: hypothetical protein EYP17_06795, partial [Candidatus Latescibacteria bacterium]|nr:hypothetical protein [Candidatus Latescibacterota bacterium]